MTDKEFTEIFFPAVKNLLMQLKDTNKPGAVLKIVDEVIGTGAHEKQALSKEQRARLQALSGDNWQTMLAAMRAKDKENGTMLQEVGESDQGIKT